jgi:hypothetical protein
MAGMVVESTLKTREINNAKETLESKAELIRGGKRWSPRGETFILTWDDLSKNVISPSRDSFRVNTSRGQMEIFTLDKIVDHFQQKLEVRTKPKLNVLLLYIIAILIPFWGGVIVFFFCSGTQYKENRIIGLKAFGLSLASLGLVMLIMFLYFRFVSG